jgi:hypothetical protein
MLLAAAISLSATHTFAAPPTAKEKAEARTLVNQARVSAKKKAWGDAATALTRADELDPNPQTKLDLARALVEEKKLVAASKAANAAMDTAKGPGGKKVQQAAKKLLADIEPRVPWLAITVQGPPPGKAVTAVDGEDVDTSTGEVPLDPGEHRITAEADGYDPAEKTIKLAEGVHERVTLTLDKTKVAAAAPVEDADDDDGGGSSLPAVLAFGVGAAGIGLGTVFGVMAFSETDKVQGQCDGNRCPPDVQDALDTAKTNGTVSTIAFVVGGVGVAAGVVLLLTSGGSSKPDTGADEVSLRPWVGPGSAGINGRF